jgi:hypothetical protein
MVFSWPPDSALWPQRARPLEPSEPVIFVPEVEPPIRLQIGDRKGKNGENTDEQKRPEVAPKQEFAPPRLSIVAVAAQLNAENEDPVWLGQLLEQVEPANFEGKGEVSVVWLAKDQTKSKQSNTLVYKFAYTDRKVKLRHILHTQVNCKLTRSGINISRSELNRLEELSVNRL